MGLAILVGTRKGLFVLRGDEGRRKWTVDDPLLAGWDVFHAIKHEDDLYAAANNWVYGATVQRSSDLGKTWERSEPLTLPEGSELEGREGLARRARRERRALARRGARHSVPIRRTRGKTGSRSGA